MERESGQKSKVVQMDKGGEYRGKFRGILPISRYLTGIHNAEDIRAKQYGQMNEPECDGEGPMYVGTC